MEIDDYTSKFAIMYKEKMDALLLRKLVKLKEKALISNELELARILYELDLRDIVKTRNELEKNGYSIEIEYPKTNYEFNESMTKATINVDQVKLSVKKVIFEI